MTASVPTIDGAFLRRHPLPDPSGNGGKHDRGTVLVVGGTIETPGALLLAGLAALRVGAGRLQIAAPRTVAPLLAVQVPEAQVIGLAAHPSGTVRPSQRLADAMASADAVLIGPGLGEEEAGSVLLDAAVTALADGSGALVIDAGSLAALGSAPDRIRALADRVVAIPNPGEAIALAGNGAGGVEDRDDDEPATVEQLVRTLGCTVALRGPETWVASPSQPVAVERCGPVGLATSGSGDVLAGMVTGHLARGADPFSAVAWAVHLHARAGSDLVHGGPELGLLARELLDVLPTVRAKLDLASS